MAQRTYAIFTGTLGNNSDILWISDDQGATWSNPSATGLPAAGVIGTIAVDLYNGYNTLIATQNQGLFKSTDAGQNYTGVPGTVVPLTDVQYITSLRVIAVGQTILISSDGGVSFTNIAFDTVAAYGPGAVYTSTYYIKNVFFDNTSIGYMSIYDKLFKSYDGGFTWTVANGGNPIDPGFFIQDIVALSLHVTVITPNGIYYSLDYGNTFTLSQAIVSPSSSRQVLDRFDTFVYAFDHNGDIWKSINYGQTFTNVGNVPVNVDYKDIFVYSGSRLTLLSSDSVLPSTGALRLSTDSGATTTVVEDVDRRAYALSGSTDIPCGECPSKFDFNPTTGLCETVLVGPPLCPEGYIYNPATGQCDGESSACENDIIIAIDNSASVDGTEWPQLLALADGIANALSSELSAGTVQIGVVQWASYACLKQPLTSNLIDISNAINVPQQDNCSSFGSIGGATNHVLALCVSQDELFNGVNARPGANKTYIVLTDGSGVKGNSFDTNQDCTYNSITYAPANSFDTPVFRDLCTAVKNDGLKIILAAVGTTTDINNIRMNFVYGSTVPGPLLPDAVPSLDANGNPLYTESDFANAINQVESILDTLCSGSIPAPECAEGCTVIVGTDGRGRCSCIEEYTISPCCFELTDCSGELDPIYTNTDLSDYAVAGQILQFQGSDACWQIEKLDQVCSDAVDVIVVEVFDTCNECLPKYFTLTNCVDETIIYAAFSTELLAVNNKVAQFLIEGVPTCFNVEQNEGTPPEEPVEIEVFNGPYPDCECCLPQPEPTPEPFVRTTQKPVKQFYHITDSACEIRTNVKFANNYYKLFKTIKNGLENPCGPVDFDKLWIEKELSDYSRINPPGQCEPAPIPEEPIVCPVQPIALCIKVEDVSGSGDLR